MTEAQRLKQHASMFSSPRTMRRQSMDCCISAAAAGQMCIARFGAATSPQTISALACLSEYPGTKRTKSTDSRSMFRMKMPCKWSFMLRAILTLGDRRNFPPVQFSTRYSLSMWILFFRNPAAIASSPSSMAKIQRPGPSAFMIHTSRESDHYALLSPQLVPA